MLRPIIQDIFYEAVSPRVTTSNVKELYNKYILLESSNLHSVYFDPNKKIMRVRFLNGSEYEYERANERLFIVLLNSESHGTKFWEIIRNSLPYKRLPNWSEGDVEEY